MTVLSLNVTGAQEVAADLGRMSVAVAARVPGVVRHFGQLYQTQVKAHASGRPGPRAITGDYRRSITLEMSGAGGGVTAVVGTTQPQGRRLEFGFHGTDSRGRAYNQAPFPHFGPPLGPIENALHAALLAMVDVDARAAGALGRAA